MSAGKHRRLVDELESDWPRYVRLDVSERLIREAAALADQHPLRAADAIHLASAMSARRQFGGGMLFACWDDGLSAAAAREGFQPASR